MYRRAHVAPHYSAVCIRLASRESVEVIMAVSLAMVARGSFGILDYSRSPSLAGPPRTTPLFSLK